MHTHTYNGKEHGDNNNKKVNFVGTNGTSSQQDRCDYVAPMVAITHTATMHRAEQSADAASPLIHLHGDNGVLNGFFPLSLIRVNI